MLIFFIWEMCIRDSYHSEYNASKTEDLKFLQIWVIPNVEETKPEELFNSISLPKFFLKIPENSDYFIFCFQLTLLL